MLFLYLSLIDTEEKRNKFEDLYNQYERLMLHVAYNILKDYHLAEDAVNDAFIKIIDNFDRIDTVDCPKTKNFIVIITKNISIDMYRKRRRHLETAIEIEDDSMIDYYQKVQSAQDSYFQQYSVEEIKKAFTSLPESQKTALYYAVFLDESIDNIAKILDEKPETIKKRLYRARKALKTILKEENEQFRTSHN